MAQNLSIVILGSGNVATQLALALKRRNCSILSIYSKTLANAQTLAAKVKAAATNSLTQLPQNADVYIVAVKDDAIEELLSKLGFVPGLIIHTSGSVSSSVFAKKFASYGVLYPLQTFTKTRSIDFKKVPILLEANSPKAFKLIKQLASLLSKNITVINSEQRKAVHIAAVFACNFTNHMFTVAEQLLQQQELPFSLLHPLIQETAAKAQKGSPQFLQTGPAIRNDKKVMNQHLSFLKNEKGFKKIYTLVSKSILDFTNRNEGK
ncbi:MAG TPA: DUF2520 domain-containing protein [Bacteroidia bacterium]|nr:DUF2520 domain-containing protein [Bacteroidia bacterium]HRH08226.1 DUF2520 domain-containing protein [Bacteroidia bacterium]